MPLAFREHHRTVYKHDNPKRRPTLPASSPNLDPLNTERLRKSKQRIVYVHDAPVPSSAANSVQVVKMCAAFREAGPEVVLIALCESFGEKVSYAQLARLYGLQGKMPFQYETLLLGTLPGRKLVLGAYGAARASRHLTSLIYTRSISAAASAAILGKQVALEMHLPLSAYSKSEKRFRRLVARKEFQRLVVISDSLRRHYIDAIPALENRVTVAHDGADPVRSDIVPAKLEGALKVGYVGQLYPGKGMEIIAAIAPRCPWASFHVIGGNPADLDEWRRKLAATENVKLHGYVPHHLTSSYIAAMDVVLAPYLSVVSGAGGDEQDLADWMSPLKAFEYMAQGRAIIASDLPVLREVLQNDVNALLRAPNDLDGWVQDLQRLSADENLRSRLGKCAQSMFLAKFTWLQRAQAILSDLAAG